MSYQVIARKWRPQTFEEVTGQEIITQTLRNALEHDRLHHAYLFSGSRGVGKTTTARLLAKALNCHKTTTPNLHPCSVTDADACASCIEISESRSMDVLEIDAASHTGIDDVRETILEGINFNPARDRYRVFIIDEVHQLSKPAFNSLLKTLEEPPDKVVFVMATTELHKVLDTIRSRCQEFEFRTIPLQKIFDRLKIIAVAEKINITDEALRELARSGHGSMRDAQSNFDQVISFSGETISPDDVTNALGLASIEILTCTIKAIADHEPRATLAVVQDLTARGHDFRNFCRDLLGLFRDLLVFKVAGEDESLFDSAVLNVDQMRELSTLFSESDLIRFFNSLGETETKLKEATQSRFVLEIGLIKLIEMRRVAPVESILKLLASLEQSSTAGTLQVAKVPDQESKAATAYSEKKTLNIDPPAETLPPKEPEPILAEPEVTPSEPQRPEKPRIDHKLFDSIPVRLPAITSEDLEHIDDAWLDGDYEIKLMRSGDDLGPITAASEWIEKLVGRSIEPVETATNASNGRSAAATAPARELPSINPVMKSDEGTEELPELTDEPTEDDLLAYAAAHPLVKKALRIFRAKVVEVKKI